ncbi:polysaccharide lyase family 7 protein [Vibrio sp. 10N.261.55.A7]|uniref:polysaccharide lyase family 7 protein n=1 Tax=Vibrio sp. 10N.261.55.A7 TaxID=1880851 RepID=UPI000C81BC79|nr:polysaccharide lyase family 7 protein [Vibrio sp. 10N.261.55.A7]PMK03673.1 alginate lyase [Vibrio sp. 10N.261.55.A7]
MKFRTLTAAVATALSFGAYAAPQTPADILDLSCWKVTLPVSLTGGDRPTEFEENDIANGAMHPDYFYVNEAGDGVVFRSPVQGIKTSENTKYVRSELREMMRCGDTSIRTHGVGGNNWVFSNNESEESLKNAAGVDGTLKATLSVDHVTRTGKIWQQGRVIIGQIHAPKDEPVKIYYRKMPEHNTGSLWISHEPNGGDDITFPMIGPTKPNYWKQGSKDYQSTYDDGIALGESFSYKIEVVGADMTVTISREGKPDVVQKVDMQNSGYEEEGEWMYFKAGVYNQNRSGDPDDYVQATFYELEVTHK